MKISYLNMRTKYPLTSMRSVNYVTSPLEHLKTAKKTTHQVVEKECNIFVK